MVNIPENRTSKVYESTTYPGLILSQNIETLKNNAKFQNYAEQAYTADLATLSKMITRVTPTKVTKSQVAIFLGAFQNPQILAYPTSLKKLVLHMNTDIGSALLEAQIPFKNVVLEQFVDLARAMKGFLATQGAADRKSGHPNRYFQALGNYTGWTVTNCHLLTPIWSQALAETFNGNPAIPEEVRVMVNLLTV